MALGGAMISRAVVAALVAVVAAWMACGDPSAPTQEHADATTAARP